MSTVIPCSQCQIYAKSGRVIWRCSGYHPERASWPALALLSLILAVPLIALALDMKKAGGD